MITDTVKSALNPNNDFLIKELQEVKSQNFKLSQENINLKAIQDEHHVQVLALEVYKDKVLDARKAVEDLKSSLKDDKKEIKILKARIRDQKRNIELLKDFI